MRLKHLRPPNVKTQVDKTQWRKCKMNLFKSAALSFSPLTFSISRHGFSSKYVHQKSINKHEGQVQSSFNRISIYFHTDITKSKYFHC